MKTTLNQIRKNHPCKEGYSKLLKFLNKTEADNDPLDLLTIFESNGFHDTVWSFRAVEGFDTEKRMFAVFCARQIQYLMTDKRSIKAINVAERYAMGQATDKELTSARRAAYAAERYAPSRAARAAAFSAAANVADYSYNAADNAARAADFEIKPVSEAYLKNLISEAEK